MFCLSKLFLASSHLCFLALSLTPSKSVWQSFLSLFPGMAPIRDSVSHSPNQTGDYTFALFLLVFSAFYSSTHCLTLALYFVINRLGKLSLTWPWQMMHFIHVKYEIERQGEMNEWVSEWESGCERGCKRRLGKRTPQAPWRAGKHFMWREALKVRDALSESDPKLCNQSVRRLVSGLRR